MRKPASLYFFTGMALMVGYAWLGWNYKHAPDISVCLFHRITGLPCPSCGTTRSVLSLSHLDIQAAVYYNPIGILIAGALTILPLWLLYDAFLRKNSFYVFYVRGEKILRKQWMSIPLVILVLANWAWNIYKYRA